MQQSEHRPALAQAAGRYRERPVAPPLREHFDCAWIHRLVDDHRSTVLVVPDGCIDLLWIEGALHVAGPDRAPHPATLRPGTTVVGLRFRPASAPDWLRIPASRLTDRRVALEDLTAAGARRLSSAIGDRQAPAEVLRALEAAMAESPSMLAPPRHDMRAAFRSVARGAPPGRPPIPWLAAELDMSERTLRRRFDEAFGYGPKTLDRILRFQRFLALVRRPRAGSAAELAVEAGYADQAHMVREVRRMSAHTPGEIARLLGE